MLDVIYTLLDGIKIRALIYLLYSLILSQYSSYFSYNFGQTKIKVVFDRYIDYLIHQRFSV